MKPVDSWPVTSVVFVLKLKYSFSLTLLLWKYDRKSGFGLPCICFIAWLLIYSFIYLFTLLVDCLNTFFFFKQSGVCSHRNRQQKEYVCSLLNAFIKENVSPGPTAFNYKRLQFLTTALKIMYWILSYISVDHI